MLTTKEQHEHGNAPSIAGHQCRPGSRTLLRPASSRSKTPEYINKTECQLTMRVIEHDISRHLDTSIPMGTVVLKGKEMGSKTVKKKSSLPRQSR